jgi:CRISPR-associated protein Cas4
MFENYIQISKLNDFIFCPRSIYFHGIYEDKKESNYHRTPQINGKIKHEAIDYGRYSTAKNILQGIEIYSEKFGLIGKIDVYDNRKKELIERKAKIKKIYQGYLYQVYAQYFCLVEMG